jgi:hypothetical protein
MVVSRRSRSSTKAPSRKLNRKPLTAAALAGLLRPVAAGSEHGLGPGILKERGGR